MVATQLATSEVTDPSVLRAFAEVPREVFLPAGLRRIAYCDRPLSLARGRFVLDPRCLAKLAQLAAIRPQDRILDVGCATGCSAAVLSRLGKSVVALEEDGEFVRIATDALRPYGNVSVVQGALAVGVPEKAPFDVIVMEGAVEEVPPNLLAQLAEDGRLVTVIQKGRQGQARLFVRDRGAVGSHAGFDASAPILPGFRRSLGFVF